MTNKELRNEFSKRLRRLAWQRGKYNQKQLSELTGISEVTMSYYYNGLKLPKADNLVKIAQVLHCSIDELIMVNERLK